MYFNQDGDILTVNDKLLKLLVDFMYLGSIISFTEIHINICMDKTKTTIDRILTICWNLISWFKDKFMTTEIYFRISILAVDQMIFVCFCRISVLFF